MEKADLRNYKALAREVQQLRDQLTALETSLYSPRGQRFTSTPRVPSGAGSTMDGAVARHMELVDLYQTQLAEKEAEQLAIERALLSLETPELLVMRFRYLEGRGWPWIVMEMQKLGYSERTVYRLHGFALLKLKEV